MNTQVVSRTHFVLILATALMVFGIQGTSFGQTITVSTPQPLTEATLHGSIVTLTLTGGTYERSSFRIERVVSLSGVDGLTIADFFGVDRVSDTVVTVELAFAGNIDTDGTLTLTVDADAIAVYESRSKAIHWDGRNEFGEQVASGVYFYHLSAGDYSATRKMLILK